MMQFRAGPGVFQSAQRFRRPAFLRPAAAPRRTNAAAIGTTISRTFSSISLDVLDAPRLRRRLANQRHFQRKIMPDPAERRISGEPVGRRLIELPILLWIDPKPDFARKAEHPPSSYAAGQSGRVAGCIRGRFEARQLSFHEFVVRLERARLVSSRTASPARPR